MTNRCDSVDALMYAYYEMMRTKEVNQMLEKNIDYIEFSMHSMKVTHKPYQVAGIEITGSNPNGRDFIFGNNPFDIPCDVVVVPKKDFDRLQTENNQLKKKLEEFSPVPGYKDFLKALYPETFESDIEKLVWATEQLCCGRDLQHALRTDLENYKRVSSVQAKYIRSWKEATGCPSPSAAKNLIDSTESWHQAYRDVKATNEKLADNIKSLKKAIGYSTPEGLLSAVTKEVTECKTLVDIINELDQEIDKWQKATKCNSPEEAEKMIEQLVDDINVLMEVTDDPM